MNVLNSQAQTFRMLPGMVLGIRPIGEGSVAHAVVERSEGPVSFTGATATPQSMLSIGPLENVCDVKVTAFGRVGVVLGDGGMGGTNSLSLDSNLNAIVTGGGVKVLQLQNSGTFETPSYDILATVLPRTGTLAELKALASGGGELASATDQPAIVQLTGTFPNGTTAVYSPMSPGIWTETPLACTLKPTDATAAATSLTLSGGASLMTNSNGGHAFVRGGTGGTTGTATGGRVEMIAGDGVRGGSLVLRTGKSSGATAAGNIDILADGDGAGTGAPGGGRVVVKFGGSGGGQKGAFIVKNYANAELLNIDNVGMGFFGSVPVAKPAVAGSRGGNAALASLISALALLGLVSDASTA